MKLKINTTVKLFNYEDHYELKYYKQKGTYKKYIKYYVLRNKFLKKALELYPDIEILSPYNNLKIIKENIKDIPIDFKIGILKSDFYNYNLELRNIYLKILLEDMIQTIIIDENTIIKWYSYVNGYKGSVVQYPLNKPTMIYDNHVFCQNEDDIYINTDHFIPDYLVFNNRALIKNMACIEIIEYSEKQILINDKYSFLKEYIKGRKDINDEILEYVFYDGTCTESDIKKLFEYKNAEIIL